MQNPTEDWKNFAPNQIGFSLQSIFLAQTMAKSVLEWVIYGSGTISSYWTQFLLRTKIEKNVQIFLCMQSFTKGIRTDKHKHISKRSFLFLRYKVKLRHFQSPLSPKKVFSAKPVAHLDFEEAVSWACATVEAMLVGGYHDISEKGRHGGGRYRFTVLPSYRASQQVLAIFQSSQTLGGLG